MLVGREKELESMQKIFGRLFSSVVVVYGRFGMGKTALVREFIKGKDSFYFSALPAAADENRYFMANAVYGQSELNSYLTSYEDLFAGITKDNHVKKVIVIDEFLNIARTDPDFMESLVKVVKNQQDYGRVMVILVSSSISQIEGNKKKLFGKLSNMTSYIRLQELTYMDTMRFFANYSMEDCVRFYGITGGVPLYISKLNKKLTFDENVCVNILRRNAYLYETGYGEVKEELREVSIYNTLLGCLAMGMNKINDIYNYTGFGRDKISVYLKNLIDRDLVEKVYSYDRNGKKSIKKGSYRVKPGLLTFWYKYLYPNHNALLCEDCNEFYEKYVKPTFDSEFMQEAFVRVCSEFMQVMEEHGQLAIKTENCARVYENDKRIDIIRQDADGNCVIGLCDFSDNRMGVDVLEKLDLRTSEYEVKCEAVYLFSRKGFSQELRRIEEREKNLTLIEISDL
jgi:hypothetical protein